MFVEWRYIFEHSSVNLDLLFLRELARESKRLAEIMLHPRDHIPTLPMAVRPT